MEQFGQPIIAINSKLNDTFAIYIDRLIKLADVQYSRGTATVSEKKVFDRKRTKLIKEVVDFGKQFIRIIAEYYEKERLERMNVELINATKSLINYIRNPEKEEKQDVNRKMLLFYNNLNSVIMDRDIVVEYYDNFIDDLTELLKYVVENGQNDDAKEYNRLLNSLTRTLGQLLRKLGLEYKLISIRQKDEFIPLEKEYTTERYTKVMMRYSDALNRLFIEKIKDPNEKREKLYESFIMLQDHYFVYHQSKRFAYHSFELYKSIVEAFLAEYEGNQKEINYQVKKFKEHLQKLPHFSNKDKLVYWEYFLLVRKISEAGKDADLDALRLSIGYSKSYAKRLAGIWAYYAIKLGSK